MTIPSSSGVTPRLRRILRVGLSGFFVAVGGFGIVMVSQAMSNGPFEVLGALVFLLGFVVAFGSAVVAFAVGARDLWERVR